MEEDFLKKQKEELLKEKKEVEKTLASFAKRSRKSGSNWETKFPQFGNTTAEQDENADEVEEYVNLLSIEHRLEMRLLDIKRAIEKIGKIKNYGTCEKCGKNIKKGRLKAVPATKFCSKCAKV